MSGIMSMLLGAVSSAVADAYFNLTTLLLNTGSTNGAQNNTFLDSSSNAFSITRNGNTTQGTFSPFSQTGWSNYFDGTDDYLAIADNALLRFGAGAFTLEAWIWRNASGAAHTIYAKGGASTGIVFQVASTNVLRFTHTTTNIDSTGTIAANSWTHVAVVREGTGANQTKLYINGTQDGQGTVSTDFTQTEEVRIGTDRGATADFNGYISNLRFVKGTALYTTTFTPSTTPLTTTSQGATATEVELLTCQDNRFLDNSLNAFAITRNGDVSVQAFSPFAPTAAYDSAVVGGSGYFDGTGDYLFTTSNAALVLNTGSWTIEAFAYLTGGTGYRSVLSKRTGATAEYEIGVDTSGNFYLYIGSTVYATTTSVPLNSWNHLCITCDGTNIRMFQNGVLTKYNASLAAGNGTGNLSTGVEAGTATQNWVGYISNERIVKGSVVSAYSTASTTVGAVIFTPPTAPLTAITNTSYLLNFTNTGIFDAAAKNDLETVGGAQVSTTQAKFGTTSMSFDGTGDYLLINQNNQSLMLGTAPFTIEFWFNTTSSTQYAQFVGNETTTNGFSILINVASATAGTVAVFNGPASQIHVSTSSYRDGAWHHFALSRDSSGSRMFIDGTQIGSTNTGQASASFDASSFRWAIGANLQFTGRDYAGYIDDLRITKGVARYTGNFTAPTTAFPLQ